jgi:hypothetical protein
MAFGDLLQFPPPGSPPAKANITERSRRHMSEECNTLIRNQTDHNPGKLYFAKMLSLPMQAPLAPLMNRFGFQSLGNEVES